MFERLAEAHLPMMTRVSWPSTPERLPMRRTLTLVGLAGLLLAPGGTAAGQGTVVRLGSGSYATAPPPGAKSPPAEIFRTENVQGKMPTSDWWTSLAWIAFSEPMYAHPLTFEAGRGGLRVYDPGNHITADKVGIHGTMPGGGVDVILGHSRQSEFPDARVDGFSDWFVTARFAVPGRSMCPTFGHGSPFVYARYEGGSPRLTFPETPQIWSGGRSSTTLGLTIRGKHYALFGPAGSAWDGIGTAVLINVSDKAYFSMAVLPDASPETLRLFERYAHSHVVDTRVEWFYEPRTSRVTTTFRFETHPEEGTERGTIFALYPHQWKHTDQPLLKQEFRSVRGTMKLGTGDSFRTTMASPGILPCLPDVGGADRRRMATLLEAEARAPEPPVRDSYWESKWLGRIAALVAIAEAYGLDREAVGFREAARHRLERWLDATEQGGRLRTRGLFAYNDRWGTLIGYPASYGSETDLNDHHFHYGYFLNAAAVVARHDPSWARRERWGAMVDLLIRDMASPDRDDPMFPFLRTFDPYAGHSWASGSARFRDGNNQESSSEAMNAWSGLILWGEATGDRAVRDLGVYLYTTEMTAIEEYWFDVRGENRPPEYTPSAVTMVWGGKGVNDTWFTRNPEAMHAINWLPIHGGSLYLGRYPAYVERNYAALVSENGGTSWDDLADLIWMYRALSDPADAMRQLESARGKAPTEAGNSPASTYHWVATLARLGRVDASVTADEPLTAVFRRGRTCTYCVYSPTDRPRTVRFSDGYRVDVRKKGFAIARREVEPGRGQL